VPCRGQPGDATIRLTEDLAKKYLASGGLPVPRGEVADSLDAVTRLCADLPAGGVVKALVPAGRRGKSGGVRVVSDPAEARAVAADLLGSILHEHVVERLYVEERIAIAAEYYLAFTLAGPEPEILLTQRGGVDVEQVAAAEDTGLVRAFVDPLRGLSTWDAAELWLQAGVRGAALPQLAAIAASAYESFREADGLLLEINPLALDTRNEAWVVGAMLGIDDHALFRHPEWQAFARRAALPANPRERAVAAVNLALPGGECQYVELDGDIGLLVGGGGAGLYQHDLVLELGGRPANHCVTPPTGSDHRKLRAVLEAIFEHPRVRGLLVGFNFAQMARTDVRVRTLVDVIDEKKIDTSCFPIVIRLFGAGEKDARAMVTGRPNIHYVPRDTTLKQAVGILVELVRDVAGVPAR
jgi:succinyl-CoA synthetase beta subunit